MSRTSRHTQALAAQDSRQRIRANADERFDQAVELLRLAMDDIDHAVAWGEKAKYRDGLGALRKAKPRISQAVQLIRAGQTSVKVARIGGDA